MRFITATKKLKTPFKVSEDSLNYGWSSTKKIIGKDCISWPRQKRWAPVIRLIVTLDT